MLASNPLRNSRPGLVATMGRAQELPVRPESLARTRPECGASGQAFEEIPHRPADPVMPQKTHGLCHACAPFVRLSPFSKSAGAA
jgi:hypothetical protein